MPMIERSCNICVEETVMVCPLDAVNYTVRCQKCQDLVVRPNPTLDDMLLRAEAIAKKHSDGHFTLMKFTTNWRAGFLTPCGDCGDSGRIWNGFRCLAAGSTAVNAIENAIERLLFGAKESCLVEVERRRRLEAKEERARKPAPIPAGEKERV